MEPQATPKSSPKDVFFHLLAIITLYLGAISFGALLFQYIDHYFPDILPYVTSGVPTAIRWSIASLIIVFPVYFWLSWSIQRDTITYPEKRQIRIRRWLFAFTLFLSAIVMIIDLITLIYNFLGGDLTTRFSLKVLVVLFIAAVIFKYYLWVMRHEGMAVHNRNMRVLVWGVVIIVVAAIIGGFFLAGSPFQERLRRFDQQRVYDLQSIQSEIINYWQKKNSLPVTLDALADPISGFLPPRDPETKAAYEYRATGPLAFELCATFETDSSKNSDATRMAYPIGPGGTQDSWAHAAERICFARTIDPELYRMNALPVKPL